MVHLSGDSLAPESEERPAGGCDGGWPDLLASGGPGDGSHLQVGAEDLSSAFDACRDAGLDQLDVSALVVGVWSCQAHLCGCWLRLAVLGLLSA
jgi:hypothetical protein